MFSEKFVVAVKSKGSILREFKDIVYLKFGEEYSILLKNLNSKRALVKVSIDGNDIGDGTKFVINANSEIELKRFIKNGNLNEGNSLKFIERTSAIENHRGIKSDDGILRIEFEYEKDAVIHIPYMYKSTWPSPTITYPYNPPMYGNTGSILRGMASASTTISANALINSTDSGDKTEVVAQSVNEIGITVPGSVIEQKFTTVADFTTEGIAHAIVMRLVGETEDNKPVVKSVTVNTKPKCVTCGKVNKATSKFCSSCGTSLTII